MPHYITQPAGRAGGDFRIPGDKSISHRALMLGSIAEGTTEVRGFLESEDCLATMKAMRTMGVRIEQFAPGALRVYGVGLRGLRQPGRALDLGNSGTAMRLMTGLLSGQTFDSELIGDASLMKRPMERVAAPLRLMGARIDTDQGRPPVRIGGAAALQGIRYTLPVASAQVKSAILLAGLYAQGATMLIEPGITRDHTERMLQSFGCPVQAAHGEVHMTPVERLVARSLEVPGDFSSAAFFMVAGSIAAGNGLTLRGVGVNPTRTGLLDILALMGADLRLINHRSAGAEPVADIEVRPSRLQGIHVPEHLVPLAIDEFPALFIAAACAQGETRVTGAEELRVKESDRIAVMAEGLTALGVSCEVLPDGIRIQGRPAEAPAGEAVFAGGTIDSHGDHRIAMAFAVASLRANAAIRIDDVANVATSFPDFPAIATAAGLHLRAVP
ncbi:3-phosphoshikimate 1-carboxyvinyltransferase [Steroidobacter denitrificans]|uniref:3-phosphoshikimate 1-carboxyvinyltransferase n=1 Tax=Steroidobacter denitrificans TaxID=465721 RepID=A0A127FB88_STEDE|nr:3-phosphoshikimate 1-carboxyvinyltransferase [Steroidobacter denitrificans]AMN46868.1 3-phosphoshikimate 1-carboxyvinyltransferase [Steroidobacter denitrificans]